ncbi:MAG: CPBP family intramembrane metalloprotease [Clostridia bacterium]|nr:CPBP family intramembrane metalloprotease [Clostridia bacterium]
MDPYIYSPIYTQRRRMQERTELKRIGRVAGCCIIGYMLLETLFSLPIVFEPLRSLYFGDPTFQAAFNMVISVVGVFMPFLIGGLYLEKRNRVEIFCFGKPASLSLAASAIGLGFFICMAGDYLTSLLISGADAVGVELTMPEYALPKDLFGRIVYTMMVAVLPPLVEEFAVRGAIMQPLRRFGDPFAIVASAFVFAVLHGNLVQAPFAFIAGIGLGYAVCLTGSIWTGVAIHFLNNFYSVILQFLVEDFPDEAQLDRIYLPLMITLVAVSALAGAAHVLLCKKHGVKRPADPSLLTAGEKTGALLLNLPMILAVLTMLWVTKQYVDL